MILCDAVQVDRASGKATILGVFEDLRADGFPAVHPELTVFAELTDGRGETPITLKFVQVTAESIDGTELYSATLTVTFPDPRFVAKLLWRIAPVGIPQPGEYRFILETEGALIAERRLLAAPIET